MSLNVTSILLVGLGPEPAALAREASRQIFPDAVVIDVGSLAAARGRPEAPGTELLLLGEAAAAAAAEAAAVLDARGWPRWPVIVFGPQPLGPMVLPPEDWNPRAAARTFHAAVAAHSLSRENARLRGDLATISRRLSHDLRTPLMGIATACAAIGETPPEDGAARATFTQSIAQSSGDISRLVDRIGGVLKATAEGRPKERVPMANVVWAALQRLEVRARNLGAVVTQPPAWPEVPGVPAWLELVWVNLVGNALDHGGKPPRIGLGWREEPGGWRFWVEDSGPGVASQVVGSLFQPFDLLHRPSAPRGWGLPLVHRLVELQGGSCAYGARTGGGSRFSFTLPA